ncbi:MAG TPA: type II toxin-antitoxin system VapC family toxin [Acetobacteraceae bacterium]|nr:type II toxin-antitoxin system VapC family toxin [Acetobacteraceae bacterium]
MNGDFVLDASIALAWCFEDEATPQSQSLLDSLENATAVVPPLWMPELVNALLTGERRNRTSEAKILAFFDLLARLPIETDRSEPDPVLLFEFARRHRLSAYDATYLHLALSRNLPLATHDHALRRAATEAGAGLLT